MGWTDRLFGKKKESVEPDPLADLVLEKLKVGYLVDYELQTWQVTAYYRYKFSEDGDVEEWELTAAGQQCYLERAEGAWSISRRISIGAIEGDIRRYILDHEDPPARIVFDGTEFYLDGSYSGHMLSDEKGPGKPLIRWEFLDEGENKFVGVEQWSETEFTAAVGSIVEDYQFNHILPGVID